MKPSTGENPTTEAGSRPPEDGQAEVAPRKNRRITPRRLGEAVFIVGSLLNIASFVGLKPHHGDEARPQAEPDPPVTLEATPELEQAREDARETAVSLADRVMDLYDEAPESSRESVPNQVDGTVTYAVYTEAPPDANGQPGTYGMNIQVGLDANGRPDPRLVQHVSIYANRLPNPSVDPSGRQETVYSLELSRTQEAYSAQTGAPVEWTLREVGETANGPKDITYSTGPAKISGADAELTPSVVEGAASNADHTFRMAVTGSPVGPS